MPIANLEAYTKQYTTKIPEQFNIAEVCTKPSLPGFCDSQTAIIVDHHDEISELSYQALNQKSNQFAQLLRHKGIEQKERIMLWLPNCMTFPIAFFGALKIGSVAVPCSMLLTGEEMAYLAKDSGAQLIVTTTSLWDKFKASAPSSMQVVLIDSEQDLESELSPYALDDVQTITLANDPAYLVYTSGTTGYPKGVLHAHRALIGRVPSAHYWFNYDDNKTDRILHSGKFNWTYVLGTALMDPLFLAKTVVVYEGENNPETWPKLIAKHQCSIFIGVPTIYRQIIQKTSLSKLDVPTLRHCMCAGEHLSDEMLSTWKQRFEQDIFEAIGMSECSYYLSQHTSRQIKPGSAGFPQPGHRIALLDENMQPVADDQEGMLCIELDDPGLFIEYWNLPEITAKAKRGNYFLTGDYARRDEEGYYWFLGRKDDIINSFGFRISPHEIERVIKTHPSVADCVAVEETIAQDKQLVAVHVIPETNSSLSEQELIAFAESHLAKYKVPKKVYFREQFPRTANGKILRKELKA